MRSLSLGIFAVVSLSVSVGLAQAAYVGGPQQEPNYPALAVHRLDRSPKHVRVDADGSSYYIVRLKDSPAASYAGGIPGLEATDPHLTGERVLDVDAARTRSYTAYLDERRGAFLDSARQVLAHSLTPRYEYRYALNGMSVKLTGAEATRLARLPGVISVRPVHYWKPDAMLPASASDTNASRAWINAPTVWKIATTTSIGGTDNEGEGVVLADLDTGINDANTSFADPGPLDSYAAVNTGGLRFGVCDPNNTSQHNQKPSFFNCNNKLIGAYTYTKSTGNDSDSPEDTEGHGSHTASTVVGNFVSVTGVSTSATPLSGVAPHASLIAYDVCDPVDLCGEDGSVAAVEQAINDQAKLKSKWGSNFKGMVLNFSIGGSDDAYGDAVEMAFLNATEAGIYVSAAGGNGGPENAAENDPTDFPQYPVQHMGPWVATLAAATHSGISGSDLESFNGGTSMPTTPMLGASGTLGTALLNIVYAGNPIYVNDDPVKTGNAPVSAEPYPASQGKVENAKQCLFPFAHGTFTNTIVVCERGTNPLVDKADNVAQGGAAGIVIITNSTSSQTLDVESYEIPGTLLDSTDGDILRTWLTNNTGATLQATLSGATLTTDAAQADQLAGFSSRGPTGTEYDSLIKPDLAAPGVSVLAALSNPIYTVGVGGASQPETYGFLDGTSMATPHDTGAAALLMQAHPSWSPAEIKSALMLTSATGSATTPAGTSPGLTDQCASLDSGENCVASSDLPSPQVRGSGRIDVDAAQRSGLVMDETGADYEAADPDTGGDLTALNLASQGNADCGGGCTWTRTMTSAFSSTTVRYSLTTAVTSSSLKLSVSPSSFTLAPGATQKLTIKATTSGLKSGSWGFGEVDISPMGGAVGDSGAAVPDMHMPVAVQSASPAAHMSIQPSALSFSGDGKQQLTISNNGIETLHWTLGSAPTVTAGNPAAQSAAAPASSSLWNQPDAGANAGYVSSYFIPSSHGIYGADTFNLPAAADIDDIVATGFAQDDTGPVTVSDPVDWYIYPDASGQPAGNPEDGKKDYSWHYTGSPGSAGIGTANGVISLDLKAAGQPAAKLAAGNYWLIVVPHMPSSGVNTNGATWYWLEGKSPDGKKSAMLIDPGRLQVDNGQWAALNVSFDFSISGTLDCSANGMPGLSVSPVSGDVTAGQSGTATITFSGSGQKTGAKSGVVCVTSNASDNPQILVPVSANVSTSSGGGSGGGGELGLLELALLGLLARRRRMYTQ